MKTNWKSLEGKKALVKRVYRNRWIKSYGDIREVIIEEVSPSGVCLRLSGGFISAEWHHRSEIKLVEVLQ